MPRWAPVALLFSSLLSSSLLSSAVEARLDLTELPIEVLMELEFIPAAKPEMPSESDGGAEGRPSGWEGTTFLELPLIPGVQVRRLAQPDGWCIYVPWFWVVVLDESQFEGVITNRSPDVSGGSAK